MQTLQENKRYPQHPEPQRQLDPTDGRASSSGTTSLAGSLLLANNNFCSHFTDDPEPTAAALALPQMKGSGFVRGLRAAMSLGTT